MADRILCSMGIFYFI